MKRGSLFVACVAVLIAWGALSFGAVYPWAYWPLAAGAALVGAYGLLQRRHVAVMPLGRSLLIALAVTLVAMLLQLIPLGRATVAALSPNTTRVLQDYDLRYMTAVESGHALSIQPEATVITATLYAALVVFLLGTARALSFGGTTRLVSSMVVIGLILAVIGIVQKPIYTGRIYGFWTPFERATNPFGPFVNRNHYAGWMAMTLSLSLGYFCGRTAQIVPHVKPGFRNRVLGFSSNEASQIMLVGFAIAVMAIAMVYTLSMAGILCLALAVVVTGWTAFSGQSGSRRLMLGGYLLLVVVVALAWSSLDLVADRFAVANWSQVNGRLGAWTDAWNIARRFIVFGSGMNTYGITTIFFQTFDRQVHYAQAHNDYLQILAEGGLLVAVPAAVAAVLLVVEIRRRFAETEPGTMTYWVRVGAVTGLLAIALHETVDFSLQMPGNAVLFAVLAAIAVHRPVGAPVAASRNEARLNRSLRVSAC
jgi:O-antigen ligase